MGDRIVLAQPVLVPMRTKDRADAVRLLAALMLAARPGPAECRTDDALNSAPAKTLPMAEVTVGKSNSDDDAGEMA